MKRILALAPLPPPFSGPEVSSEILFSGPLRNLRVKVINISVKKGKEDRGFITPSALLKFSGIYLRYIFRFPFYDGVYLPITATRLGWYRDMSILVPAMYARKRLILHMRGGHFHYFYRGLKDDWFKKAVYRILNSASRIIVQSPSLKKQFRGIVPEDVLEVLPNPFHPDFLKLNPESPERKRVRVLFVGLFTVAKGYHDLVHVAENVLRNFDVEFVFLGNPVKGEKNIFFNQITGESLEEKPFVKLEHPSVRYLKDIYGREKVELFEKCSIFVLPSYSEGFSMAVLEAMVSGCAVITTPAGAMADYIEHEKTGILINPGDREALHRWLVRLIEDEELRRYLGENARRYALENFHPDRVRNMLEEIFLRALSQSV